MDWTWGWTAVGAIATWFLVLGIVWAILQVRETRSGRNAELAVRLYEQFGTSKTAEILSRIYHSSPDNVETSVAVEDIEKILDNIEVIGTLVKQGIFDEKLAVELFGVWPLRCWSRLNRFIDKRRKERGNYGRHIEYFARQSIKYQIKHHAKKDWTSLTVEGREKENLVEELQKELLSSWEQRIAYFTRWTRSLLNKELRESKEKDKSDLEANSPEKV